MENESAGGEVRYTVKELLAISNEALGRIEAKVDANALSQAEAIGRLDTRVTVLENKPNLETRVQVLENARSEEVGARGLGRFLAPLALTLIWIGLAAVQVTHLHL